MTYRQRIRVWVDNLLYKRERAADANVADLVAALEGPAWDGGVTNLTRALGGRYLTQGEGQKWTFAAEKSYQACSEDVLRSALAKALCLHIAGSQSYEHTVAIFDLLAQKNRWQSCLTSIDSAYSFALLMIHVAYVISDTDVKAPFVRLVLPSISSGFKEIASQWLDVDIGAKQLVRPGQMAALLFGQEWCDYLLKDPLMAAWQITIVVERSRPAFAPGLLAPGLEVRAENLPDLAIGMSL